MRRDRATDLLQDILDFIGRIEGWTPANLDSDVGTDEKTLYAVLHALQHIGESCLAPTTRSHRSGAGNSLVEYPRNAKRHRP